MNKNEIILAANLNPAWRYRDQLRLVQLLSHQQQDFSDWTLLNRWLLTELGNIPAPLMYKVSVDCYLTILDDDYPDYLAQIYQPPIVLFYCGDRSLLSWRKIGIVGARNCTTYSHHCLRRIIPSLVQENFVIVSGLAMGVDQLAHQETLLAHGKTISVLGNGIGVTYPAKNRPLQMLVATRGLVVSEYAHDAPPRRFQFVARNRIIAGLCQGVLVTEAQEHSGSLITANYALQENRNVYAIPGSILWPYSQGTNQLISAGAKPVLCADDLLSDYPKFVQNASKCSTDTATFS